MPAANTFCINGADTPSQRDAKIKDSKELLTNDATKGGALRPELVKVLCKNSGADVEWLMGKFALDRSLVTRLSGRSAPRTHRGKERFPDISITYAVVQVVEKQPRVPLWPVLSQRLVRKECFHLHRVWSCQSML